MLLQSRLDYARFEIVYHLIKFTRPVKKVLATDARNLNAIRHQNIKSKTDLHGAGV